MQIIGERAFQAEGTDKNTVRAKNKHHKAGAQILCWKNEWQGSNCGWSSGNEGGSSNGGGN